MGIRHRTLPIENVQYHPESVLSEKGMEQFENFLKRAGNSDAAVRKNQTRSKRTTPHALIEKGIFLQLFE